ncbi:ATP-binding protein [Dietzia cinnamea]|uniref:ATP-binding protein n=1 Tax=Dietzia cinnamea TaxID=321318 RepID=UPI00223AC696|nr:ATP-binding protein [Dietzia cinnamea]MCT2175833.1 ATP-binding protein [Dietzia cinnamea]
MVNERTTDSIVFEVVPLRAFGAIIDLANDPACDEWTFSEKIFHALDKEITARQERRTQKLLKASRSPNPDACVEEFRYLPEYLEAWGPPDIAFGGQQYCRWGPVIAPVGATDLACCGDLGRWTLLK